MSLSRYLLGAVLVAVFVSAISVGARSVRRRVLIGWSGPPAVLADSIIALSATVVLAEVLGTIRLFRVVPVLAVAIAFGITARRWAGDDERSTSLADAPALSERGSQQIALTVAGVAAVAVVSAAWASRTLDALRYGMTTSIDTNWYHLPVAARFVQDGTVTSVHYLDAGALTAFYPATSALLHGLGMMLMGSDILSPLLNLLFLALTLLAAWCLGRAYDAAPLALVAATTVLALPILSTSQPGGAYNDVVGIAFVLAAAALLATWWRHAPDVGAGVALAGLAGGLALGTKYNFILPVASLTVLVIAVGDRRSWLRRTLWWTVPMLVTGGFFYLRNLVIVGNPLPPFRLGLGPFKLPTAPSGIEELAPLSVLRNGALWRSIFRPAFAAGFGPVWWLVLAFVGAGLVAAIVAAHDRFIRGLGILGAVTLVGYLVTPASLGTKRLPIEFVYSLRYAAAGVMLGFIAGALVPWARRHPWPIVLGCGVVLVATQLDPSIWPTELRDSRFSEPVHGAAAVLGVVAGACVLATGLALVLSRRVALGAHRATAAMMITATALVLAGAFVHHSYVRNRYTGSTYLHTTYRWARDVHDQRIAVVGTPLQYALYGNDLSNYVQYVGHRGKHGAFTAISTCRGWRRALQAGRYDFVVVAPNPLLQRAPIETLWTGTDPAASVAIREGFATVFRIDGAMHPDGCRALGARATAPNGGS